jgi:hypothetical protein
LEVGAEGEFKLDLRQDRDSGKQKLKGAEELKPIGAIIANRNDGFELPDHPFGLLATLVWPAVELPVLAVWL